MDGQEQEAKQHKERLKIHLAVKVFGNIVLFIFTCTNT